jgi:hypothetical protein
LWQPKSPKSDHAVAAARLCGTTHFRSGARDKGLARGLARSSSRLFGCLAPIFAQK